LRSSSRAFTLLEVMVAVAILGLSLTVILSAQAGLYAGGSYAQHTSIATGLLRCRMSEIEERLMKLGYPEADENDDGACCDDDLRADMRCEWKVERIELPSIDPAAMGSASAGGTGGPGSPGGPLGALMGGQGASSGGPLAALGQLTGSSTSLGLSAADGGVSSLASTLSQGTGGGMSAIAQLAMSFVYPTLKPMLEASIRKVTVKVAWKEGVQSRELSAIQYVTRPMRSDAMTGLGDGGVPLTGPSGTSTSGIGTSPTSTSTTRSPTR
jgi:general secretion pathway protein I